MSSTSSDRRFDTRFKVLISAEVDFCGGDDSSKELIFVKDISAGGAYFITRNRPDVGTKCELSILNYNNFYLDKVEGAEDSGNVHLMVNGKIVRVRDRKLGSSSGVAVHFEDPVRIIGS